MEMLLFFDLAITAYGLVFGCLIGVVYDFFRVFRLIFHAGTVMLFIEDLIFSLLFAISVFAFCFVFNSGKIRFFYLIAALLGWLIYYLTVGKLLYRGLKTLFSKFHRLLSGRHSKQPSNRGLSPSFNGTGDGIANP